MSSASFALPEFPPRAALSGGSASAAGWQEIDPHDAAQPRCPLCRSARRAAAALSRRPLPLRASLGCRPRSQHSSAGRAACCARCASRCVRAATFRRLEPLLLVANHVSWLDAYALNTVSTARFVAKSEVRGWPIVGVIADALRHLFPRTRPLSRRGARGRGAGRQRYVLGNPWPSFRKVRRARATAVLRFYPAMFQAAVLSGARVQPIAIRYRTVDDRPTRRRRTSARCRFSTRCATCCASRASLWSWISARRSIRTAARARSWQSRRARRSSPPSRRRRARRIAPRGVKKDPKTYTDGADDEADATDGMLEKSAVNPFLALARPHRVDARDVDLQRDGAARPTAGAGTRVAQAAGNFTGACRRRSRRRRALPRW